jgi:hypothetical protein
MSLRKMYFVPWSGGTRPMLQAYPEGTLSQKTHHTSLREKNIWFKN